MKFLLVAIVGLCLHTVSTQQKYSDLSDSFTEMLLGTTKGNGFGTVHTKLSSLASNMDSKNGVSNDKIHSSVLDLLNGIELNA